MFRIAPSIVDWISIACNVYYWVVGRCSVMLLCNPLFSYCMYVGNLCLDGLNQRQLN
jgi:hypothetical protein